MNKDFDKVHKRGEPAGLAWAKKAEPIIHQFIAVGFDDPARCCARYNLLALSMAPQRDRFEFQAGNIAYYVGWDDLGEVWTTYNHFEVPDEWHCWLIHRNDVGKPTHFIDFSSRHYGPRPGTKGNLRQRNDIAKPLILPLASLPKKKIELEPIPGLDEKVRNKVSPSVLAAFERYLNSL